MVTKKKEEPVIEETPQQDTENVKEPPVCFLNRLQQLGAYVRLQAPSALKFDSNVGNIDYDYVDTQQYKVFIAACCDQFDIGFLWQAHSPELQIIQNDKGKQVFIVTLSCNAMFYDRFSEDRIRVDACGMGTSFGNNYALSIAQTNAMRNFLTNNFMLPTNDRDNDDMKSNVMEQASKFLTDDQKSEERKKILNSTKSSAEHATLAMGNVVRGRIMDVLEKDIPEDFKKKLEGFLSSKYEEGKPKKLDTDAKCWVVKKTSASAIMSELDEYNG